MMLTLWLMACWLHLPGPVQHWKTPSSLQNKSAEIVRPHTPSVTLYVHNCLVSVA
jgi:hypothetical protein